MIAPSDIYVPIMAREYACIESNIRVLGDPMTDLLLNSPHDKYDFSNYKRFYFGYRLLGNLIIWDMMTPRWRILYHYLEKTLMEN